VTGTARVFRLSAVRFWLWAVLLYLAFLAVVGLLIRWTGLVFDPIAVATMTLALTIILVVSGLKYRAVVSAEGLGFTDLQGGWLFVRWREIEWAQSGQSLGLPILELRVAGLAGHEGLLLLLGDLDGFRAAVAAAAGPSHPVTWALLKSDPARH
jgi:hypothetical protein